MGANSALQHGGYTELRDKYCACTTKCSRTFGESSTLQVNCSVLLGTYICRHVPSIVGPSGGDGPDIITLEEVDARRSRDVDSPNDRYAIIEVISFKVNAAWKVFVTYLNN